MATNYVFIHKRDQDERRILLLGKHLVTATKFNSHVVQEFKNDAAAKAHVDHIAAVHKRAGYFVREFEETPDDAVVLPQGRPLDPLHEFVSWIEGPSSRLEVSLTAMVSSRWLATIVDRIEQERPLTLSACFLPIATTDERFSNAFVGRSLPTVRYLIVKREPLAREPHFDLWVGDVANFFVAMPYLQRAFVVGDIELRPFQHAALRELHLQSDPIRTATLEALATSSLPVLETLGIRLRESPRSKYSTETLAIALSKLDAPRLESLRVQGIADIAHCLDVILRRGLPKSLRRLRLEGEIIDEDALLEVVTRHIVALRQLRRLALPLRDQVSLQMVARMKQLIAGYVDRRNHGHLESDKMYRNWYLERARR